MPRPDGKRELDFRRGARPTEGGPGRVLAFLGILVLVTAALWLRAAWEPRVPPGTLVEVQGDVPRPGMHRIDPPTLRAAVEAAGGDGRALPDTILHAGDRVVVTAEGVRIEPASDPLLVALPIDVNTADPASLAAVPGIGRSTAEAIVADRARHGPFHSVEDLGRVRGLGPSKVREIEPFLTVGDVGPPPAAPGPLDVNTATAAELETLPGIGPVTAARIVVDREENGPYRQLTDLTRVRGIGPRTVERLADLAVVRPP